MASVSKMSPVERVQHALNVAKSAFSVEPLLLPHGTLSCFMVTRYVVIVTRYVVIVTRYVVMVTRYVVMVTRYVVMVTRYVVMVHGTSSCDTFVVMVTYYLVL